MRRLSIVTFGLLLIATGLFSGALVTAGGAQDSIPAATVCAPPTRDEMQALAEQYGEAWNNGDSSAFAAILSDGYQHHWSIGRDADGAESFLGQIDFFLASFDNLKVSIEQILIDGESAAIRWTAQSTQVGPFQGFEPVGDQVSWTGMNVIRVECGKIVEAWSEADHLGRLQRQGAIPAPAATPAA